MSLDSIRTLFNSRSGQQPGIPPEVVRLKAERRFSEAIEAASAANRRSPSVELERELVDLRVLLAKQLNTKRDKTDTWPWRIENLFPHHRQGLVEITREELSVDKLASAIVHHGALIVRGLIPPDDCDRLRGGIDRTIAAQERWHEDHPQDGDSPWYFSKWGRCNWRTRKFVREQNCVLTADSPRMLFDLLEVYTATGIIDTAKGYLRERPVLSTNKGTLRRVDPSVTAAEWHQDGRFLDKGRGLRALNIWLSLSHCGVDAPTLEIVARRLNRIVTTGTDGTNFDWTVSSKLIADTPELHEAVVVPVFAPGDVLFFDEFNLHRTASYGHMTRSRYAIETWLFAPTGYPPRHSVLAV